MSAAVGSPQTSRPAQTVAHSGHGEYVNTTRLPVSHRNVLQIINSLPVQLCVIF